MLDTSLSAESKELASSNAQATSSIVEQDQRVTSTTVMSAGKGTSTVMTLLGNAHPLAVQRKTEDRAHPVQEDKKDENEVEVNYDPESTDEVEESALRAETMAGQPALRKLSREHPALRIEPTTALVQEPSSRHEKDILIIVERKDISIKTPRLNHNPQRAG